MINATNFNEGGRNVALLETLMDIFILTIIVYVHGFMLTIIVLTMTNFEMLVTVRSKSSFNMFK